MQYIFENDCTTITASSRIGQRIGCSAAYNARSCKHSKSYDLGKLTALAVDGMCTHLTDPERIKANALAKTLEFARLEKENNGARQGAVKQFDRLNIQIAKLVRMIDEEDDMPRELLASLKAICKNVAAAVFGSGYLRMRLCVRASPSYWATEGF